MQKGFFVVLVIGCCLLILLTILNAGLFIERQILRGQIVQSRGQIVQFQAAIQAQNQRINSFTSQLQDCKNIREIDVVLKGAGVERR